MARPSLLIGAAALIALGGCDVFGPAERYSGPLSFEIREGYYVDVPPPPQIVLLVSTETTYPCLGYSLEHGFSASGSVLHVVVSDVVRKPRGYCAAAIGPAGFRIALPVSIGTYVLEFTRDGETDRHSMEVTDSTIQITTLEAHFTHPGAPTFPRAR
jgi:hypothetical protein